MATNEPTDGAPAAPEPLAAALTGASEPAELKGRAAITIDPFAPHWRFAHRFGVFANASTRFLDGLRPPIDVRADKVLDLSKFGQEFKGFYKPVRLKQAAELKDEFEERRLDVEPQFILRNLRRVEKENEPGAPLEFKRVPSAVKSLDPPPDISKIYAPPELLPAMGYDHAREERKWRRHMLEEMDWNRYFSREIREKITGPLWAHDPDKNPVPEAPPAPAPTPAGGGVEGGVLPEGDADGEASEPREEFL